MGLGMAVLVQSFIDAGGRRGRKEEGESCASRTVSIDDPGDRYLVEKKEAKVHVRRSGVSM